jgi:hypothetical protein
LLLATVQMLQHLQLLFIKELVQKALAFTFGSGAQRIKLTFGEVNLVARNFLHEDILHSL